MLSRSANLPDDASFTVTFWYYHINTGGGSNNYYWNLFKLTDGTDYRQLYYNQTSDRIGLEWDTSQYQAIIDSITNNTWYFCAMTCTGVASGDIDAWADTRDVYPMASATSDSAATAITPTSMELSSNTSTNFLNGRLAAVKIWDAVLTASEIEQERYSYIPKRTSNLNLFSPLIDNVKDYSGNGRDWTETGTVLWEDGPPIPWGSAILINTDVGTGGDILDAQAGSYAWTGQEANLEFNRRVAADPGSYAWTGQDATLTYTGGYDLSAEAGAYALTGQDAALELNRVVSAEEGSYVWDGQDVILKMGRRVGADPTSYAWSGADIGALYDRAATAESATFQWNGNSAQLTYSGATPTIKNSIQSLHMGLSIRI
jgi:hypothetical protein